MGRRVWWIAIVVVTILILLRLFCRPKEVAQCPDHDTFQAAGPGGVTGITEVKLAGATTFIPEFHDCQRLIDEGNFQKFGTLAGVWVSESLAVLSDSLLKLNSPQHWIHPSGDTGWVAIDTAGWGPADSVNLELLTALPFAVIHAWDGKYEHLGISEGWNCLYLYPSPNGIGYSAAMVPVGDQATCFEPYPVPKLRDPRSLTVHVTVVPGLSEAQYPAVGRWDTDPKNKVHYIGLKCGAAWCEVAPKAGYVSSAVYAPNAMLQGTSTNPSDPPEHVLAVKGWYDEQRIALGSAPSLTPADFKGIVIPDPGLDATEPFPADTWIPAGWAALGQHNAKYQSTLNIAEGKLPPAGAPEGGTDLWICKAREGCDFGGQQGPDCDSYSDGSTWYAKMQARVSGEIMYTCLTRRGHDGLGRHIPGVARWRWDPKDEKLWFRCDDGCCTTY